MHPISTRRARRTAPLRAALLSLLLPALAQAQLEFPRPPAWRGALCSAYAGFGTACPPGFTSAFGADNLPDDPASSPGFAPTLRQLQPGAILTSTCNIYHPSLAPRFQITVAVPGGADALEVLLQVRSAGNSRDPQSFELRYGAGPTILPPGFLEVLGAAPGAEEVLATWDLSGIGDSITSFTLAFEGSASNLSLDVVELDLRYDGCATGTPVCFGDGSGSACPCGNSGAPGNGCANAQVAAGANLSASGTPAFNDVVFQVQGLNPTGGPAVVLIRSTGATAGSTFGDGLLCVSPPVARVASGIASGGALLLPVTHGAGPGSFVYQAWYRSLPASFCDPVAGFNLSNAYQIVWP